MSNAIKLTEEERRKRLTNAAITFLRSGPAMLTDRGMLYQKAIRSKTGGLLNLAPDSPWRLPANHPVVAPEPLARKYSPDCEVIKAADLLRPKTWLWKR